MEILVGVLAAAVLILAAVVVLRGSRSAPSGERLKLEFQALSQEVLTQNTRQLLELAEQRFARQTSQGSQELEGKKELIDQQLNNMKLELGRVTDLVQRIEREREAKFGQLTEQIKAMGQQTQDLTSSTSSLREALASSQRRGQWGERMAEDILMKLGFKENINYLSQASVEGGGARPDFTFLLPEGKKLNMDVKFPFDNYMRYVESESDTDKETYLKDFLRDVRGKVDEVGRRAYIDPAGGTVDCAILFIPNESVYAFIHEKDHAALDYALRQKVIWCSPLTLYCVLAVVRQAMDNFAMEQTSNQIISLMGSFKEQWNKFTDSIDTVGKRLDSTHKAFQDMSGARRRALERPLQRIEDIRRDRGIATAPSLDGSVEGLALTSGGGVTIVEEESAGEG